MQHVKLTFICKQGTPDTHQDQRGEQVAMGVERQGNEHEEESGDSDSEESEEEEPVSFVRVYLSGSNA